MAQEIIIQSFENPVPCNDGEVALLSTLTYPLTLTQNVPVSYGPYNLVYDGTNIMARDGITVILTFELSNGVWSVTYDAWGRTTVYGSVTFNNNSGATVTLTSFENPVPCNDGDVASLSTLSYPLTLTQNIPVVYGSNKLVFDGTYIKTRDVEHDNVVLTFTLSSGVWTATADVFNRTTTVIGHVTFNNPSSGGGGSGGGSGTAVTLTSFSNPGLDGAAEIKGLHKLSYPLTLQPGIPEPYENGTYSLLYNGTDILIKYNDSVYATFQLSDGEWTVVSDVYNRTETVIGVTHFNKVNTLAPVQLLAAYRSTRSGNPRIAFTVPFSATMEQIDVYDNATGALISEGAFFNASMRPETSAVKYCRLPPNAGNSANNIFVKYVNADGFYTQTSSVEIVDGINGALASLTTPTVVGPQQNTKYLYTFDVSGLNITDVSSLNITGDLYITTYTTRETVTATVTTTSVSFELSAVESTFLYLTDSANKTTVYQVQLANVIVTPVTPGGGGDGSGGSGGGVVPCFFGNAPVLTKSGYRRMDSLRAGDKVMTPEGVEATVERVKVTQCTAGPHTNPYVIPRGRFGAERRVLISPNHKVVTSEGMVEARHLGLEQEAREGTLTYYNLELAGQANMVVGGVAVESLAPVKRMVLTMDQFKAALQQKYGAINAGVLANIQRTCRFLTDGRVEVPVLRR